MFLLSIEIKMQNNNNKESILILKKVWGRRLGDAAGERRSPNAARTKNVPQTLDPTPFGGRVGRRGWRCSKGVFM
jgi:hypothetical protein